MCPETGPQDEPFHCPECRCKVTLPEEGIEGLKTAFFINRFKSAVHTLGRLHGNIKISCEECTEPEVMSFCRQCSMFICKLCVDSHKRMKTVFAGHQIVSINDLKANVPFPAEKVSDQLKCSIHQEPSKLYCFDCNELICRDCTVLDLRDHKFQFNAVAAPEMKEKLLAELNPLKTVGQRLSWTVAEVKSTIQEIEAQNVGVVQTINDCFEELVKIVEVRRKVLLEEAGRRAQEKVGNLTAREKNLSQAYAEVQSVVDYTERCLEHGTDNEVMSMLTEMRNRIQHEVQQQSKTTALGEEIEEVDIGVDISCANELQQLCETKANVIQLPIDPLQCALTGAIGTAVVDQISELILTANRLTNSKLSRRSVDVSASLVLLQNMSVVNCVVQAMGSGEYRIQYTPKTHGKHELQLSINGHPVLGSPVSIDVSSPHPVRLLADLHTPPGGLWRIKI